MTIPHGEVVDRRIGNAPLPRTYLRAATVLATDVARVIGQPIPLWLDGTRLPDYLAQTHHHLGEPILVPYLAARSIPLRLPLNVETSLPDGKLDIDVKVTRTELAALYVCPGLAHGAAPIG